MNRKGKLILISAVIFTAVLTFFVSTVITVRMGDKYIVSKNDFDYLIKLEQRFGKTSYLMDVIEEKYYKDLDEAKLIEGANKGIFDATGDRYTDYFDEEEFTEFNEYNDGKYGGIGIILDYSSEDIVIVSPIEDTPGERAGLQSGDVIKSVDGEVVNSAHADKAVDLMRGEAETDVLLEIYRPSSDETKEYNITREMISVKSVKSVVMEDNLGYLRITNFDNKVYKEFKDNLNKMRNKGIKGLVIDLRNNPGGDLQQCVKIADDLLGKQTIVYRERKDGKKIYEKSDEGKLDIPYVILVNGGSASASEILTGAVKDTDSGVIIGTKTFGKGIVQTVYPLEDGTGFKLTTSEYFTPNGINIHGIGIEPNIVIELSEDDYITEGSDEDYDVQLKKAIEVLNDKIAN
ncbi:MAG: S41 family peptidase [Firmicutes bacterium]|jgi:carboxyl-terminal processing protease|nr:S41 family peptidase [Bacillota bacterium]